MMHLDRLFTLFSKREHGSPTMKAKSLTREFKTRVVLLVVNRIGHWGEKFVGFYSEPWTVIHKDLQRLYGNHWLIDGIQDPTPVGMGQFFERCTDDQWFDFIELFLYHSESEELVNEINTCLREDDLPFFLTGYVQERCEEDISVGYKGYVVKTLHYPHIIRRDSELLHETAIQPAITLLANPAFKVPNDEFLDALEYYRKGDYKVCLTQVNSAFESVVRVICERNRWKTKRNDPSVADLLKIIFEKTEMDPKVKPFINQIVVIRSEEGNAHGGGTQERRPSEHMAKYVINVTASAILLLIAETKMEGVG